MGKVKQKARSKKVAWEDGHQGGRYVEDDDEISAIECISDKIFETSSCILGPLTNCPLTKEYGRCLTRHGCLEEYQGYHARRKGSSMHAGLNNSDERDLKKKNALRSCSTPAGSLTPRSMSNVVIFEKRSSKEFARNATEDGKSDEKSLRPKESDEYYVQGTSKVYKRVVFEKDMWKDSRGHRRRNGKVRFVDRSGAEEVVDEEAEEPAVQATLKNFRKGAAFKGILKKRRSRNKSSRARENMLLGETHVDLDEQDSASASASASGSASVSVSASATSLHDAKDREKSGSEGLIPKAAVYVESDDSSSGLLITESHAKDDYERTCGDASNKDITCEDGSVQGSTNSKANGHGSVLSQDASNLSPASHLDELAAQWSNKMGWSEASNVCSEKNEEAVAAQPADTSMSKILEDMEAIHAERNRKDLYCKVSLADELSNEDSLDHSELFLNANGRGSKSQAGGKFGQDILGKGSWLWSRKQKRKKRISTLEQCDEVSEEEEDMMEMGLNLPPLLPPAAGSVAFSHIPESGSAFTAFKEASPVASTEAEFQIAENSASALDAGDVSAPPSTDKSAPSICDNSNSPQQSSYSCPTGLLTNQSLQQNIQQDKREVDEATSQKRLWLQEEFENTPGETTTRTRTTIQETSPDGGEHDSGYHDEISIATGHITLPEQLQINVQGSTLNSDRSANKSRSPFDYFLEEKDKSNSPVSVSDAHGINEVLSEPSWHRVRAKPAAEIELVYEGMTAEELEVKRGKEGSSWQAKDPISHKIRKFRKNRRRYLPELALSEQVGVG